MSFVRMQEFYESPKFKGKYFTLEQYMDYWSREFGKGSFTYPSVWNGFNLPGKVLADWWDRFDNDRRYREKVVLEKITDLMQKERKGSILFPGEIRRFSDQMEKIYIIGAHKGKDSSRIIEHELSHALYYLYPEYRKSCQKLLKGVSKKDYRDAKKELINQGYCKKVIDDELQAYFSTEITKKNSDLLDSREEFVNNFSDFKEKIK
jgi:hypothetical protein